MWVKIHITATAVPKLLDGACLASVGIIDADKIQPACRGNRAAALSIFRLQGRFKIPYAPFAFADPFQGSNEGAHLIVQEGARGTGDLDFLTETADTYMVQRFDRRSGLTIDRAKGREVMLPDQNLAGGMHQVCIERAADLPGQIFVDGQRCPAIDDPKPIMPFESGETGFERLVDLDCLGDGNPLRPQMGIHSFSNPICSPIAGKVGMRDLGEGVYSGVSASGALNHDTFTAEAGDRLLDGFLYGWHAILTLPACIVRAVIFDCQFETGHDRF